jgi:Tfp pilus assembly major pilin PilA
MRKSMLFPVLLSVAACSGPGSDSDSRTVADVAAFAGEMPIADPWLRRQLPPGTLSYQRIPHPFGLLAIPKGNTFDAALGSEANIGNLIAIQRAFVENLGAELPPVRWFDALRSPIEIAAVGLPVPSAMIGATLSFRANADFEAFVDELSELAPVTLAGPLDAEGFGQLAGAPVPILVHFDDATGRLALYGGMFADPATFATLLEPPADAADHPMHALEAQVDDSGQGLFAWIDATQALPMGAAFMPPEMMQSLTAAGIDRMRALAVGTGVANGKGRLMLVADLGTGDASRPLPILGNEITATAVGEIRKLFLLSLPAAGEFTRLETTILATLPPESADEWAGAKAAFAEVSGTSIEEVLSALGPELMMFSDDAGDIFAVHVRDRALLDGMLERWAAAVGVPIESRDVGGGTIRYWELPGSFGMPTEAIGEVPFVDVLGRMRNRVYWVADGDYLYLAGTPQVLIDRIDAGADVGIAEWLDETQRFDVSSALVAATGTVERLPRTMYNAYIGVMQTFADVAGAEYDVWAMPTANQLGLPERGSLGLAVNLGEPYVSIELSYESHPFELLLGGGGMAAVAGLGIAAAVAIPAYQDYTIRAQVSEGLNLAAALRLAVAAAWNETGQAPADRAAAGLAPDGGDAQGAYVAGIDVVDGEIVIRYGNQAHAMIAGTTLALTPYETENGSIEWRCGYAAPPAGGEAIGSVSVGGTTIGQQYLPSNCR